MLNLPLDDQQREQLLLEHLPQVHHVARRIHFRLPPQVPLEDLVHAGIIGLIDAVRRYDPAKNVKLKHYAEFRIRGAIIDSLRLIDWSPRALRREARRLDQAVSECRADLGRDPCEEEIAGELGVSLEYLQEFRYRLAQLEVGSLHAELNDESGEEEIERCTSKDEDPYRQALRSEMTRLLAQAIRELPRREGRVLSLYHFHDLTMKEIGFIMRIGESRVSQIHSAALVRLRTLLPKMLRQSRDPKRLMRSNSVTARSAAKSAQTSLRVCRSQYSFM